MLETYTNAYVEKQLLKFRERATNHWQRHIRFGKELAAAAGLVPPQRILDLGCSIGTFALEFSLDGFSCLGLDFDEKALAEARKLAGELSVDVTWICADAANFRLDEPVDAIACFDLLEHLPDETLRAALRASFDNLRPGGAFLFHTFPCDLDHVFYTGFWRSFPMVPFFWLGENAFRVLAQAYSRLLDLGFRVRHGKTHGQMIQESVHPNPLSPGRLQGLLLDTGFEIESFSSGIDEFNPLRPGQGRIANRFFRHQPAAHRSLWGIARKPSDAC